MQIILLGIFTIKKHVRGYVFVVSNINNVIAEDIEMPNYQPINLIKSNCELSDGLTSLYSKGPSFITTPNTFDWRQLQTDFDV